MFFNITLLSSLLLFHAVLAVPSWPGSRVVRRGRRNYNSLPNNAHETSIISNTQYGDNWAGAVWIDGNDTFSYVTGTFTAPTPSGSPGASAAAWVGIDGNTCRTAILQTGVTFTAEDSGPTYTAWYEWFPAPAYDFFDITISAGDDIKLTVTAFTPTSGIAVIDNLTSGQTVSQNMTSSIPLCGQNAEWIVEDYWEGNGLVPFADFGTVTFTNAVATGAQTYTQSGATIFDIEQNNQTLTSTSISNSSISITYV